MTIETLVEKLEPFGVFLPVIRYLKSFKNVEECYCEFDRGDWLLSLIAKLIDHCNEDHLRKLTLVKGLCAQLVIHLMDDERSRRAVEVAIAYGNGTASREDLDAALTDAHAAAFAAFANADDSASANATHTAACSATTAATVHGHSSVASYAAEASGYAVYASAADSARKDTLKKCADIVRAHYSLEDLLELLGE
jgi:hypothetical protein